MKKRLSLIFLVTVLIAALVVGCGGQDQDAATDDDAADVVEADGELQDGFYLAKSPVDHGNFSMATMEVVDGEIESFKYSEIMATTGEEKNEENYSAYTEVLPVIEDLNEQFNEKKDLSEMDYDATTGCTGTVETFEELVNELLAKAQAGDTYTPVYTDGEYNAKADEDSRGWLGEVNIVIRDGQIVGVDYFEAAIEELESSRIILDEHGDPELDDDGNPKTEEVTVKPGERKSNENYNYPELFDTIEAVQELVINNNGTEDLDVDAITGSTGSRDIMIEVIEKALADAK
ncbi:MAG TPA: hypothetical protein GXX70_04630 [Tepidimicrobium sp.]|nr:hypothetical protein [Tepidimicrobium sp.]